MNPSSPAHAPLRRSVAEAVDAAERLAAVTTLQPVQRRPTRAEWRAVESALGVPLPPSLVAYFDAVKWHVRWVTHLQLCCAVAMFPGQPLLTDVNLRMWRARRSEAWSPRFLVCVSTDAALDGDHDCLDTRHVDANGECPVVYWSPEQPDVLLEPGAPDGSEVVAAEDLKVVAPDYATYVWAQTERCLEMHRVSAARAQRRGGRGPR